MKHLFTIFITSYCSMSSAMTFEINKNSDIVGAVQTAVVQRGESLGDIGRKFDIGVYEMIEANPRINAWSPMSGSKVVIPAKFILPKKRRGIVINLAEMRLYYFHRNGTHVSTYPIGIGKKGWLTPIGSTKITQKKKNPTWFPPASIRKSHKEKGDILPNVVPPGPKNPLGKYAMKLGIPGYLIHGTNRPGGIGVRSSSGCIRMFPEDIKALFNQVSVGTRVEIIHEPYKVGKVGNDVFLEAHIPLSDPYYNKEKNIEYLKRAIKNKGLSTSKYLSIIDDKNLSDKPKGYPIKISF